LGRKIILRYNLFNELIKNYERQCKKSKGKERRPRGTGFQLQNEAEEMQLRRRDFVKFNC